MICDSNDCLNCKYEKCLLEVAEEAAKIKNAKDRREYMRRYYIAHQDYDNHCAWCGKECKGEMIRIDKMNYCGINCVFCHLYEKNEKKMKIIIV